MVRLKRFFTLFMLFLFMIVIFHGDVKMYADDSPALSLTKTDFIAGEAIVINYTGTKQKDWIGIYKRGGIPGVPNPSIMWEYTSKTGQPDGTMEFKDTLPVGSYDAVLCQNDGYTELFRVSFNVVEVNVAPSKPSGASYNLTGAKGEAEGKITIEPSSDESNITNYVVYWGNEKGKLEGYTPIAVIRKRGRTLNHNISKNVIIPEGANCILVYGSNSKGESEDYVKVDIPENMLPDSFGTPLYKFQVITDTHVRSQPSHVYNKNFDNALKQIKELAPDSIGIMHSGDITDTGLKSEYREFKRIWDDNKEGLPNIYFTIGNHDLYTGSYSDSMNRFSELSDSQKAYNDYWIEDLHFIFLGSEKGGSEYLTAELSKEQLDWLKAKLAENASDNKPIFVFIHQPLMNTVAGSYSNQGWYGVNQDKQLRDILSQYPQAILFTGHTHWEFDSRNNMYDGKGSTFYAFNASSVAYLWTDANAHKDGSQGYFVEIYKDKILVRGRDFANSKWVPSAQFKVNIAVGDPEDNGNEVNETPGDETPSNENKDNDPHINSPGGDESKGNVLLYVVVSVIAIAVIGIVAYAVINKSKKA